MPKQSSLAKKEESAVKKVSVGEKEEAPIAKKVTVPITPTAVEDASVNMQTKYSTPLDEIKDRYVRQLSDRKHASAQRKFIIQSLKRVAIFIVIIGAGVLIGFAIKPGKADKRQVAETSLQNVPAVNTGLPAKDDVVLNNSIMPEETTLSTVKENVEAGKTDKKEEIQQPDKLMDEKKFLENATNSPSVIEAANGERSKNIRTNNNEAEPVEKRNVVSGDLSDQVFVKANDYKERDFGGFRNLQLTVTNDSKVTLESVIVELTYKKFNDDIVSIKNIPFRAINPGEFLTIKVPDNNRGAKLSYRIIKIDPRDQ